MECYYSGYLLMLANLEHFHAKPYQIINDKKSSRILKYLHAFLHYLVPISGWNLNRI